MVLMAVANTNYRFMYVDIGSYGKDCGSTIFKWSSLWTSIQTNMLELPSERPLSGTEGPNLPYFFVGDEGFAPTEIYFDILVELTWVLKKSVQLPLVQSTKVRGMCFWNFEQ